MSKRKARLAELDQPSVAYTNFSVPTFINVKNTSSAFMKSEHQTGWVRRLAERKAAEEQQVRADETRQMLESGLEPPIEESPLQSTIIIHPGSRFLRIGRASDFYPVQVPNCIARKSSGYQKPPMDSGRDRTADIAALRESLRNRMRLLKLRATTSAGPLAVAFNESVKAETLPEHNDPYRTEWTETGDRDYLTGEEALKLPDSAGYTLRYPLLARGFNTRDYDSPQLLLDDIETILTEALANTVGVQKGTYDSLSVILVVPDHVEKSYLSEMANLLLNTLGFKQLSIQQEAYCAIFGAGIPSACVVDIGAEKTSITCVDEGQVVSDSRNPLAYGGEDITRILALMLQESQFPYKELNLSSQQDWLMMDALKMRMVTLVESHAAPSIWDFHIRRPGALTLKYSVRTFEEPVMAPMCLFEPQIIDFDSKAGRSEIFGSPEIETIDTTVDGLTAAMTMSTAHLRPAPPEAPPVVEGVVYRPPTPPPPPPVATTTTQASQMPLDHAIASSIAMCGSDTKIKNVSAAILLIGGGALIPGAAAALESRLGPIIRARHPTAEPLILPPPRGIDPRFVCWKGAQVMCSIESMSDMWMRRQEWLEVGMRALKEHTVFLS